MSEANCLLVKENCHYFSTKALFPGLLGPTISHNTPLGTGEVFIHKTPPANESANAALTSIFYLLLSDPLSDRHFFCHKCDSSSFEMSLTDVVESSIFGVATVTEGKGRAFTKGQLFQSGIIRLLEPFRSESRFTD